MDAKPSSDSIIRNDDWFPTVSKWEYASIRFTASWMNHLSAFSSSTNFRKQASSIKHFRPSLFFDALTSD